MTAAHNQLPTAPAVNAPVRLYLCGPMTGYPESNYPAFGRAAAELRALGYDVRNPAELEAPLAWARRRRVKSVEWDDWMRVALALMLQCDALCLLPGWEESRGACLERDVACSMGWQCYTLEQVLTGEIDGGGR